MRRIKFSVIKNEKQEEIHNRRVTFHWEAGMHYPIPLSFWSKQNPRAALVHCTSSSFLSIRYDYLPTGNHRFFLHITRRKVIGCILFSLALYFSKFIAIDRTVPWGELKSNKRAISMDARELGAFQGRITHRIIVQIIIANTIDAALAMSAAAVKKRSDNKCCYRRRLGAREDCEDE
uniref:Uncharacterized protein n=1 Tax=Trichogramma kaykai TaxID=54128 RepID=A0ABD2XIN2_9HYME